MRLQRLVAEQQQMIFTLLQATAARGLAQQQPPAMAFQQPSMMQPPGLHPLQMSSRPLQVQQLQAFMQQQWSMPQFPMAPITPPRQQRQEPLSFMQAPSIPALPIQQPSPVIASTSESVK